MDHFSKWDEVEAIDSITIQQAISFVSKNIFTRFRILKVVIIDNETQFASFKFKEFCRKWEIDLRFSSIYHPQTNGTIEVTNRTILQEVKKKLDKAKGNWPEELPHILWVYKTTPRTARGETPFSLLYGAEVIIPWRSK